MNKVGMALSGAAMYLGACTPMTDANGHYTTTRCDISKDRVTLIMDANDINNPFDDTVVGEIKREQGHEYCQPKSNDKNDDEPERGGGDEGGSDTDVETPDEGDTSF